MRSGCIIWSPPAFPRWTPASQGRRWEGRAGPLGGPSSQAWWPWGRHACPVGTGWGRRQHRRLPATAPPHLGHPFLSGGCWLLVCPFDSWQTNWKASEGRGQQTRMPSVQRRPPDVYRTTLCARLCAEDTGPQKNLVLALGGEGRIQKVSIQRRKCYPGKGCRSLSLEDGHFSEEAKRGW